MNIRMEQTMRWFGPDDGCSLRDIRQAGCTGVVTALHHIPYGAVWTVEEIQQRKKVIEDAGLTWSVIESLPVHEDIKKQTGDWRRYIENYKISLQNVAICGLKVVTYNFMPILDWLRTDVHFRLSDGSEALRFEQAAFHAFDLFILQRPNAARDYSQKEIQTARKWFDSRDNTEHQTLQRNVLLGLPGSKEAFTMPGLLRLLRDYTDIDRLKLKKHLFDFLQAVVPVAEHLGLKLAIHPDDPPFSVLGLPRVVSTSEDLADLRRAIPSPANGLCFCTGSFGARADNHLLEMLKEFGDHIHFLHLRNTKRDKEGNFYEAPHLDGDADMPSIIKEVSNIMNRKQTAIPMRPDHGHKMLDDLKKDAYPGYSGIGRLKGLAELRGLEMGILFDR